MKMLRLNDPACIRAAHKVLHDTGSLFVSFAAQGTHIPLLIVHVPVVKHWGYAEGFGYAGTGNGMEYYYVAYMEFGGVYPLMLGNLMPGYVADKLRIKYEADALNITAFLNALGQSTVDSLNEYLSELKMSSYDPTALDFDHHKYTGWPQ